MESVMAAVLTDILEMTEPEIEAMRSAASPSWATRLAAAPTVVRECWAEDTWTYEPGRFDAISAPTLLVSGAESPPSVQQATRDAADAIPDARIVTLEGHAHFAHKADPATFVDLVTHFIAVSGSRR
jgi:pimeloyl-ACP methyl ester carboxylesterase